MRRCIFFSAVAWVLSSAPLSGWAVTPYEPAQGDPILEPWRWRYEEALEGVGAICMDEAPDGTLWFGATGCIASYDGHQVERIPFDEDLLSKISHDRAIPWAKALLLMEDGSPLALIGESLVLWKNREWRVIVQDVGRSVFSCRLARAEDGAIWVLVPQALWRVEPDLSGATRIAQVSDQQELAAFCLDRSGDVWAVERTKDPFPQLIHIPMQDGRAVGRNEWERFRIPSEHDMNDTHLVYSGDGRLWYADSARKSGLLVFDPESGEWIKKTDESQYLGITSLFQGQDGSIWGGMEGGLVRCLTSEELRVYPRGTLGLPLVPISLFEVSDNRMWVIGRVGYVYSVDLGTREWMSLEGLQYQCETPDGKRWYISLEVSIVSHDPGTGEWLEYSAQEVNLNRIFSLVASSHGLLWATGRHQGMAALSVFDGTRWSLHGHADFARWIEPRGVIEASDATMWFGAGGRLLNDEPDAGGILQYGVDGRTGQVNLLGRFTPPDFPYYSTAFAQTPDGALWVGSTLIFRVDKGGEGSAPVPVRGLGGENTVSMAVDHEGSLWVAKEHFGVSRRLGDEWEVFSTEDGVASLLLSDLLVLDDGSLLASSDGGISRFDGKSWTTHAYPERFGMVKRWSGMKLSPDGSIWLNYSDDELQSPLLLQGKNQRYGTVRHMPETIPPETRIVECLAKVAQPGNTHITWEGRDPWGETARENLQYSWRLDGGEWSPFTLGTGNTFLNLEHGRHVLEVRARDQAFNIDPTPDRSVFVVIAPLWLQFWFIAMIAVMAGGAVLLIWTMVYFHEKGLKDRQRHLVEVDQMKTSFFTNISHELNTPLSLISEPLKRVLAESELSDKNKKRISMALRNANRVSVLVSQILDLRKLELGRMKMEPLEGNISSAVYESVELLQPLARMHGVTFLFKAEDSVRGWFDADKLKKIVQNLAGNAIKFTSPGGEVSITLRALSAQHKGRKLELIFEDTGSGIEPEHLRHVFDRFYRIPEKSVVDGSGIGLNLVKELVGLWGGTVAVESPIHENEACPGTRFTVVLPLDRDEV
ncbi:ATP-binding protein [Pontiella desulfatans]|nr:ATP-binding protein [Pontiella desulfatans]